MSPQPISALEFRESLSMFATGVTIVTACHTDGEPVGMTASSFNSVSMDPPLVLWSVTKENLSAEIFKAAEFFAIHILASDQIDLSNRFAQRGGDKFGATEYELDGNGVPLIADVVCRLDCHNWQTYEGGDHWIIVGEVRGIEKNNREPLVFSAGSYATASAIRPASCATESATGMSVSTIGPVEDLLIYHLSHAYHHVARRFHAAVHDSGLSVPEWRVLASLRGPESLSLDELSARTFIEDWALQDLLMTMEASGLCHCRGQGDSLTISGTVEGDQRVSHLFELGSKMDAALPLDSASNADQTGDLKLLITLLKQVLSN